MEPKYLTIRGGRIHNLKNINVDLPRNKLIIFTGVSGSGKSSLAFDTLYAEGQRRYVESLSTYARQFLGQMDKPEVDSLEGLSPAVSIEQKTTSRNPRSTVGTVTEIYDHLRLLFARVGHPHCPDCGEEIRSQSVQDMVADLMSKPIHTKIILLAPLVDGRKGTHQQLLAQLRKDGYVRIRLNGTIYPLDQEIKLDKNKRHFIEAVIDRLVIKESIARRLTDSVETVVKLSAGFLLVNFPESRSASNQEILYSEKSACIKCNRSMPALSTQLFSFNNPKGACSACDGLGVKHFFDPQLVVPDSSLSLNEGAVAAWHAKRGAASYSNRLLAALAEQYNFNRTKPFKKLSSTVQKIIFHGTGRTKISFKYTRFRRQRTYNKPFEGILPQLHRRYLETTSTSVRDDLAKYMNEQPCPACHGTRLKPEALAVRIGSYSIYELTSLSIAQLITALPAIKFSRQEQIIVARITKEILDRLSFLNNVGLGYISLERRAATLSGGEAQRIRLASQIGCQLAGVLYILDEPSIGLHQRDNHRLIKTLTRLRDLGNTVVVVEHDEETIRAADHILDMGLGAGIHGGEVIYNGNLAGLLTDKTSITGGYLAGRLAITRPCRHRQPKNKEAFLTVKKAAANNLKEITVSFPLGLLTCVTGVSGSGKSSLLIHTLFKEATNFLQKSRQLSNNASCIQGLSQIDKVIDIDQSSIGRTPRSNPATYTGVLTPIRELFSRLPEARARGYKLGRFSFNIKGGRCEACEGDGLIKIAMHFLPDIYVTCESCQGLRYNQETLNIKYRNNNIADILAMNIGEALTFFAKIPAIKNRLQTLYDVGLSYLTLGQSSVTLSGGEAQRIKLARELSKRSTGRTLYILDEPTTGLHPADIQYLLNVLNRLVESGNTVIVIEHNMDMIKNADYIVDLGPEGGDQGGHVVAVGTPEDIAACKESYTGNFLQKIL